MAPYRTQLGSFSLQQRHQRCICAHLTRLEINGLTQSSCILMVVPRGEKAPKASRAGGGIKQTSRGLYNTAAVHVCVGRWQT